MNRKLTPVVPLLAIAFAACSDDSLVGPANDAHRHADAAAAPAQTGTKKGDPAADTTGTGGTSGTGTTATGTTGTLTTGSQTGSQGASTRLAVTGGFSFVIPAKEVIVGFRSEPFPAAAGGICGNGTNGYAEGTWVKTTKGATSVHELHVHCTIKETTPEQTVTVAFADVATYVQSPNGNLALNFDADCASAAAGVTTAQCTERTIHYKANQSRTEGKGVLTGQGSDGSVWTIDLAQIAHATSTRPLTVDGIAPTARRYVALTAVNVAGGSVDVAEIGW